MSKISALMSYFGCAGNSILGKYSFFFLCQMTPNKNEWAVYAKDFLQIYLYKSVMKVNGIFVLSLFIYVPSGLTKLPIQILLLFFPTHFSSYFQFSKSLLHCSSLWPFRNTQRNLSQDQIWNNLKAWWGDLFTSSFQTSRQMEVEINSLQSGLFLSLLYFFPNKESQLQAQLSRIFTETYKLKIRNCVCTGSFLLIKHSLHIINSVKELPY